MPERVINRRPYFFHRTFTHNKNGLFLAHREAAHLRKKGHRARVVETEAPVRYLVVKNPREL